MAEPTAFVLNGKERRVRGRPDRPLIFALRDELGVRSVRFGCGQEGCGACMVLVDGEPAFSCTRPVDSVEGRSITTVEGLGERQEALRQAFLDEQAGQCGYCLSGILVSAAALLNRNPKPSREEITRALDPHLCRCGVQNRIVRAVERAGRALAEDGGQ